MRIRRKMLVLVVAALCASCSSTRTVRLYPANDIAIQTGVLEATFIDNGSGNGEITLQTPDGESFRGEYSLVRDGMVGFGSVYGAAYGGSTSVSYFGNSTMTAFKNKSQGAASGFGTKGTTISCEFISDTYSGHGNGACKTSKEALYRINF